jgi:hypothetical protein
MVENPEEKSDYIAGLSWIYVIIRKLWKYPFLSLLCVCVCVCVCVPPTPHLAMNLKNMMDFFGIKLTVLRMKNPWEIQEQEIIQPLQGN